MWLGRLAGDKLLYLKQGNLRAVLLQEPEQILGFDPHGGGIVIGVYADQVGILQKGLIQLEDHLVFPVIEQAKGRGSAPEYPSDPDPRQRSANYSPLLRSRIGKSISTKRFWSGSPHCWPTMKPACPASGPAGWNPRKRHERAI